MQTQQIVILDNHFFLQPEGEYVFPAFPFSFVCWMATAVLKQENWMKSLELFCEELLCLVTKYSVGLNHVRWDC